MKFAPEPATARYQRVSAAASVTNLRDDRLGLLRAAAIINHYLRSRFGKAKRACACDIARSPCDQGSGSEVSRSSLSENWLTTVRDEGFPPRAKREAIMKQVETAQILDVEMDSEIASPFGCGVKVQYDMAAVTELDFAPISAHASG